MHASAALSVSTSVQAHSNCGRANGRAFANATGGVMPYTYDWSGGLSDGNGVTGLSPGTYTVTVTDAAMEQATADVVIDELDGYGSSWQPFGSLGIGASYCDGELAQMIKYSGNSLVDPYDPSSPYGPGPYSYWGNAVANYGQVLNCSNPSGAIVYDVIFIDAPPGTDVTVNYSDADGCEGTAIVTVPPPFEPPSLQILNITPSCLNAAAGTLSVAVNITTNNTFGLYVRPAGQAVDCVANTNLIYFEQQTDGGVKTFVNLPPGDLELVWTTDPNGYSQFDQGSPVTACEGVITFTVPVVSANCGGLTGTLFIDDDANCILGSENRIPNSIVRLEPGPIYLVTDQTGRYDATLPYGSYTITEEHPVFEQSCAAAFTLSSTATQQVNTACSGGVPLDALVSLTSGAARPGFELQYGIRVSNLTPSSTGAVTLTMEVDPLLGFLSANPAPTTVAGNVLTWAAPAFSMTQPFQGRTFQVRFQVPPDVGLLGTTLQATATLITTNADADPSNNTYFHGVEVTGSYDPNDKLAVTNTGKTELWQLGTDEWIDYTIRFQNTGTDTAFTVVITDTLPSNLDPGSIIIGAASHSFTWELRDAGTLKFYFLNILLPDSNVNEPRSHGFVGFRIRPRLPLLPGEEISNIANIYFDFNPPVITEPSVLTVASPGVLVAPRVLLGGPYVQATQRMSDGLRAAGLLPFTEPYTALGYAHVGGGGESISPAMLTVTGDNAIVDWVVVELRSATSPYAVLATRSALLQRDGDVVATNDTGPVTFSQAAGNYRIAVRHRNHLGAMTNAAVALNTSTATLVDLSASATGTFGTNARKAVGTRMVLWSGDSNFNGVVRYAGSTNDRDLVLVAVGGTVPTNVLSNVYAGVDIDMDGTVRYTGTANDRDIILMTIGGVTPTAVILEQLP